MGYFTRPKVRALFAYCHNRFFLPLTDKRMSAVAKLQKKGYFRFYRKTAEHAETYLAMPAGLFHATFCGRSSQVTSYPRLAPLIGWNTIALKLTSLMIYSLLSFDHPMRLTAEA